MDEDITARPRPKSAMTVRELIARLREKDPDFLVMIDASSQSLMIVNPRPGLCAPTEREDSYDLTEEDQRFLRKLHIKD